MNDIERENIENQILLRSTGELSPGENTALEKSLADNAAAAAFARFVAEKLPASAPRDFAAAAIRDTSPVGHVIAFPRLWKLAVAAAVVVASLVAVRVFTPDTPPLPVAAAHHHARVTADISARMDALESELAAARQRLAHGRYHRTHDTL